MSAPHRLTRREMKQTDGFSARHFGGKYYVVTRVPLPHSRTLKFACVIAKKDAPRAIDRNRAKRVCRELLAQVPRTGGAYALVVRIKRTALNAPRHELSEDIVSLIRQARTALVRDTIAPGEGGIEYKK